MDARTGQSFYSPSPELVADPAQLVAVDRLELGLEEGATAVDVFPEGFLEF